MGRTVIARTPFLILQPTHTGAGQPIAPNPKQVDGMGVRCSSGIVQPAQWDCRFRHQARKRHTHQLVSGARAGIGEPDVAAGGLSNSIMPGKTKLRQCAALTMVATRVAVITSA